MNFSDSRHNLSVSKLIAVTLGFVAGYLTVDAVGDGALPRAITLAFRLHAPELPSDSTVYLTGSLSELGNWDPQRVKMNACGNHRWAFCLSTTAGKSIEYKYTLGSWEQEGADAAGQPLQNFTTALDRTKVVDDEITFWTQPVKRKIVGQITGMVRYHRQMSGEGLRARDVIVWLPPDYKGSGARYPVLYMHDGQNLFDPHTSAFGVDWQVDETCTQLIQDRDIPPLIVVGIYNTADRSNEYMPGPMTEAYMRFVVEVVKPMIDREYRTLSGREHTFVGGSSAGGTCAFMLAWQFPQVFSKAFCFSPALEVTDAARGLEFDYAQTVRDTPLPSWPLFFYLDNGGQRLEAKLQPGIDSMLVALKEKGLRENVDFLWVHDSDDWHSESAWARRFPEALKAAFSGFGE